MIDTLRLAHSILFPLRLGGNIINHSLSAKPIDFIRSLTPSTLAADDYEAIFQICSNQCHSILILILILSKRDCSLHIDLGGNSFKPAKSCACISPETKASRQTIWMARALEGQPIKKHVTEEWGLKLNSVGVWGRLSIHRAGFFDQSPLKLHFLLAKVVWKQRFSGHRYLTLSAENMKIATESIVQFP